MYPLSLYWPVCSVRSVWRWLLLLVISVGQTAMVLNCRPITLFSDQLRSGEPENQNEFSELCTAECVPGAQAVGTRSAGEQKYNTHTHSQWIPLSICRERERFHRSRQALCWLKSLPEKSKTFGEYCCSVYSSAGCAEATLAVQHLHFRSSNKQCPKFKQCILNEKNAIL